MFFRRKRKPITSNRKLSRKVATRQPKPNRYRQKVSFTQSKIRQLKRLRQKRFKGNLYITRLAFLRKLLFGILCAISSASFIYIIFFSQFFNLQKWEIVEKDITFYNHYLDEFLKPYQGENLIFIKTEEIKNLIAGKHPNLSKIEIKKIFPRTISISIEQYPILANIINIVGEEGIEQKILINSIGIAIEKDAINPELPTIKMRTSKSFNLLEEVISIEKLSHITSAIKEFENGFGIKIIEIEYKITERELHLRTEKGFWIWLDIEKNSTTQFLKLKKALAKLDIYSTPLEYIDLRISGAENDKVIYKKK